VPTIPPTSQFTAAGVELTISYMNWFPGAYRRCTIIPGSGGCSNFDYSLDCNQFIGYYNSLVARQNLAPQNAEEPVRTAAAIYTATITEFIEILNPQVAICQEQLSLGRPVIDSRELGNINAIILQEYELTNEMQEALTILRNVEAG
jgi:hypothetical protein